MVHKAIHFTGRVVLILAIAALILLGLPTLIAEIYARQHTVSVEQAPDAPVAIVFGAGLNRDGSPSPVLRDRISTAAELYFNGKVQKLLMSGDNRFLDYNEPGAMRAYALEIGIPPEDIVLDYAGRRTYDTCYRAMAIFGVDHALLVTQNYHLPRALVTCQGLGLNVVGVPADRRTYHPVSLQRWRFREIPATLVAFLEVFVFHPLPVLGEPEPIFSENPVSHP